MRSHSEKIQKEESSPFEESVKSLIFSHQIVYQDLNLTLSAGQLFFVV